MEYWWWWSPRREVPPWELFGVDKRDPPIGSLEDIGNGFVRSITRNLRTGEVVVKEYEADIDLL